MSDKAHEETDKILEKMEKKVAREYKKASKEVGQKLKKYLDGFKKRDAEMQKKLDAGEITQDAYNLWRMNQLATGDRWQAMRDTLAEDMVNANKIAKQVINGNMADVYSMNRNYAVYQVEKDAMIDTSFTLYNRKATEMLFKNDSSLLPMPREGSRAWQAMMNKDLRWNQQKINSSLIQGILQGESNDDIADRLIHVVGMNCTSAIRNARTMTTSVENRGRNDAYDELKEKGVELETVWVATLDDRTRHSHRQLHGEVKDEKTGKFSNGLRYPADPAGDPEEVYNCRCAEMSYVKGFPIDIPKWSPKMGDMTFEEWLGEHEENVTEQATQSADFKSIFKNIQGINSDFADGMAEVIEKCSVQEAKNLYEKFGDQLIAKDDKHKRGAYFSRLSGGIFFNASEDAKGSAYQTPYEVAFHEFSHMMDNLLSGDRFGMISERQINGKMLIDVIRADFQAFKKANGCSRAPQVVTLLKAENMDKRTCGNISDILEKCTGISYPLGIGHGAAYHKRKGATEAEFFAEVLDSSIANEAAYGQMKRLFPNAVELVWEMVRSGL